MQMQDLPPQTGKNSPIPIYAVNTPNVISVDIHSTQATNESISVNLHSNST